jgi:hypothetical protein
MGLPAGFKNETVDFPRLIFHQTIIMIYSLCTQEAANDKK